MRLAVRTSSGSYGVALIAPDGSVAAVEEGAGAASSPGDLAEALLRAAGLGPSDIAGVLVDLGPGGLSSTRVGVSFANAFAYATGARLSGVSALDLQIHDARRQTDLPLVSLRPAPGGQVYWLLDIRPGTTQLAQAGCERLPVLLSTLGGRLGRIAVTGPLARLKAFDPTLPDILAVPIDAPAFDGFAHVTLRAATRGAGIARLEPLVTAAALCAVPETTPQAARAER